jgi:hypothetical protein
MKGHPQISAEWADALEDEAVAEVVAKNGTVDEIRDAHARIITELFEGRAKANTHSDALVQGFRRDMKEALVRVDALAAVRERGIQEQIGADGHQSTVVINTANVDENDLEVGKFQRLAA